MAPEQVRGEPVGAATDIFSLGCTLAEMLTGDRPFYRATAADSLAAVLHAPAPDLLASGRDIPPRFADIVRHCLEKDAAERFSSAADVAMALRALTADSNQSHANLAAPKRRATDPIARGAAVHGARAPSADADYLADGITESIINSLSQLPKLRVVPRATVFAYKKRDVHARSVGLALNVDSIVTGRVVQQNGAHQHPGRAHRRRPRTAGLGRPVPPPAGRPHRPAGTNRLADLGSPPHPADRPGEEAAQEARDRQLGGLPALHARPPLLGEVDAGRIPGRGRALPARDRATTRRTRAPTPA